MSDNKELLDFLTFGYFGETYSSLAGNDTKYISRVCAMRAYQDLARTLTYKDDLKTGGRNNRKYTPEGEDIKNQFISAACEMIVNSITQKLFGCNTQESFEKAHKEICESIKEEKEYKYSDGTSYADIRKSALDNCLHYGQAQKWLNMTLKYMLLLGVEEVVKIKEFLHVPVDRFVFAAATYDLGKYFLNVEIAPVEHEEDEKAISFGRFKENDNSLKVQKVWKEHHRDIWRGMKATRRWSKLKKEDYTKFQDALRSEINKRKEYNNPEWAEITCPIDWEAKAWIEVAQRENK